VVHDVPLLVENRMSPRYHLVLVVHAPEPERVRRLVTERGMALEDAWARVRAQAGDEARREVADAWLDNTGSPADLLGAVDGLWADRLVPFADHLRGRRAAPRPALVTLADPDPRWPVEATRLLDRIAAATGSAAVLRRDHVGPTAVPGLVAQDVLDLQLVLTDLAAADGLEQALGHAGYARCPGSWWDDDLAGGRLEKRLYQGCDPARPVNLHLREDGSPAWSWTLQLRDWLRVHPAERDAYGDLERRLVGSAGTGVEAYASGEGPLLADAVRRARAWAARTGWQPAEQPG
jgi:dephospho-CoA kinase